MHLFCFDRFSLFVLYSKSNPWWMEESAQAEDGGVEDGVAANHTGRPTSSSTAAEKKSSAERSARKLKIERKREKSGSPRRSSRKKSSQTKSSSRPSPSQPPVLAVETSNEKPRSHRSSGKKSNGKGAKPRSQAFSSATQSSSSRSDSPSGSNSGQDSGSPSSQRQYTIKELVASLGESEMELPVALERRVRDFKFAQSKRKERHGEKKHWGIFGLYVHLSDIRADLEWAEDAAWRRQRGKPYLSWTDFEKSRDAGINNRPWFTYIIITLCTIMMFVTIGVNGWKFAPLDVNPLIGPTAETLIDCGARQTNLIVNEGQWFRLFSPLILHAGLVHYVINMLAMWYIGAAVEQSHGFASAAVLFFIPAVGGNILSAICLPQYISVGASGGIFGLIGGCVADIIINWNLLFLKTTTDEDTRWRHFMVLFWLGTDILVNCLIGLTPFVDNFTHLGGFLYGLCCGFSTIEQLAVGFFGLSFGNCSQLKNLCLRFMGLILSVVAIMVTTGLLVQSDGLTSPCPGCRYISCVPFPFSADDKWWYCDDCDSVTADLYIASNGSGLYEEIDLQCPDGSIESIVISDDGLTKTEDVRRQLPSYCREYCDEVFSE